MLTSLFCDHSAHNFICNRLKHAEFLALGELRFALDVLENFG